MTIDDAPTRRRGQVRRGALFVGLAAAVSLGSATAAFALPPDDAPGPVYDDFPSGEPVQNPAVARTRERRDAIEGARTALALPGCRDYIGSSPQNESALQVLDNVSSTAGGIVDDWDEDPDGPQPGTKIAAQAEGPNGGSGFGKGSQGVIRFFKGFHEARTTSYVNARTHPDNKVYQLDPGQQRVLVVLHELLHLVGKLDGDHVYTDGIGNASNDLASIEDAVIINCIPNARRVDRPAAPGGGSGSEAPGTQPGGAPGDNSVTFPDPPLQEHNDVVLGDDFEEDFGSSEQPVIRDEDGTVLEGGVLDGGDDDPYGYEEPFGYEDPGDIGVPYDPGYGGGDYVDPGYGYGYGGGGGWGGGGGSGGCDDFACYDGFEAEMYYMA